MKAIKLGNIAIIFRLIVLISLISGLVGSSRITAVAAMKEQEYTTAFSDDFSTDPNTNGLWRIYRRTNDLNNEGSWDSTNNVVYLTRAVGSLGTAMIANYQLTATQWQASFKFRAGGGSGADGLVFLFYKNEATYQSGQVGGGGSIGFFMEDSSPVPGYGIEFDNWYNGEINDPSARHIAIVKDTSGNHLAWVDDARTEDNIWHDAVVEFDNGHVVVKVDSQVVLDYVIADPDYSFSGLGFSSATGLYNNNHIIDDFVFNTGKTEQQFHVSLEPANATLEIGQTHSVTATVTDLLGLSQVGVPVTFSVDSGPNTGTTGSCSPSPDCSTNENGQVSFAYGGKLAVGIDQIKACFIDPVGQINCSKYVYAEWTKKPIIHYYALGDSIASGHGLKDEGNCRRSDKSYPHYVKGQLLNRYEVVDFHHLACSGASATRYSDDYLWIGNQVNDAEEKIKNIPANEPVLVTISIGANDFQWSDAGNFLNKMFVTPANSYFDWINRVSDNTSQVMSILSWRLLQYPNVSIVINELYNPFNETSILFLRNPYKICREALGVLTCYEKTKYGVNAMNNALFKMTVDLNKPGRIWFAAGINSAFYNHASPNPSCGNSAPTETDSWIQYIGEPDLNSELPQQLKRFLRLDKDEVGDCFHPNYVGAQKMGEIIDAAAKRVGR